jgi:hypothetical protein
VAGYRIEEQIGQGGMAVVFRAYDERLERQVALKVLAPALATDESFRRRFIRESRSAAAVDHPHIIPVFDAGEADGVLFLAMRYVPAGDAGSLIRQTCAGRRGAGWLPRTSIQPLRIRVGSTGCGWLAGPRPTQPSVSAKRAPCSGQVTVRPATVPRLSRPPAWLQMLSIA